MRQSIDSIVLEKMARLAKQSAIRFNGAECGGFLISDGKEIVQMLVPYQDVNLCSCNLSRGFREAYVNAYKSGMSLSGIWHSHANYPLSHSSDDYSCISNFLGIMGQCNNSFQKWNTVVLGESSVGLFNMHRGYEVRLKKNENPLNFAKGILSISESLNNRLLSIVINRETYDSSSVQDAIKSGKYHATESRYDNGRLVSGAASIFPANDYCEGIERLCSPGKLAAYPVSESYSVTKESDGDSDSGDTAYASKTKISIGCLEVLLGENCNADEVESICKLSSSKLAECRKEIIEKGEADGKQLRQCRIESMLLADEQQGLKQDIKPDTRQNGNFYDSARMAYMAFRASCESFRSFYLRGSGIARIAEHADNLLLKIFGEISEAPHCNNCGWESKLEKINKAYSEFRKYDIIGECYVPLLDKVKSLLENCPAPKKYEKSVKKLCNAISKKSFFRRISDCTARCISILAGKTGNNSKPHPEKHYENAGRMKIKDGKSDAKNQDGNPDGRN